MSPVKTRKGAKGKPTGKARAPARVKAPKATVKSKGKAKAATVVIESDSEEEILTRITIGVIVLKVFVDDGVGSHSLEISTWDNLEVLHTKVAAKMGQPVHCVHMGYDSPWGSKVGQKKRPVYIISDHDLDHFWVTSKRHIDSKIASGRKSKSQAIDELGSSILFVNMLEISQVSPLAFFPFLHFILMLP